MTPTIRDQFASWAHDNGHEARLAAVRVEDLGVPHEPKSLPEGWQGVYCFGYKSCWLKVGKAGPKSHARWKSHHYSLNAAPSTLAFSLLKYAHMSAVTFAAAPDLRASLLHTDADTVGEWIRQNTRRVDLLISSRLGATALASLEMICHRELRPLFEGRWKPAAPPLT